MPRWKSPSTPGLLLILGLVLAHAVGCATVPVTGRKTLNLIPEGEELALGADSYQQVLAGASVVAGGPKVEMVRRVGGRLARVSHRPDYAWEFNLIEDDAMVNAFCLPGGKVAVYTGLLPVARDEAGLAVVMGHEIAHAIARHGGERMTDQLAFQIGGMGLTALLKDKSPAARELLLAAYGVGGTVGFLLPFSRKQESEADHIGLIYMAEAGYDPREAITFWKRMDAASTQAAPPEWLSTHPAHDTRTENLERLMPDALRHYRPEAR